MKMNKIVALTFPAILISATLSAETLTYDNSAYGSFYYADYWGGILPSESSDILFTGAQTGRYELDATQGITVNSVTDNAIVSEGYGNNIFIRIGTQTFAITNDLTLASNHRYSPFTFRSDMDGEGEVSIGGNLISQAASDGTAGESLFGEKYILKSVTVGGNIELQNSKLRFHAHNLSAAGMLNFSGGELNLFYGTASGQSLSYSFGGINATGKTIYFGDEADNGGLKNSTVSIELKNSGAAKFSGSLACHKNTSSGNAFRLNMNASSDSGVQYVDLSGTGDLNFSFDSVTVTRGKLNYCDALGKSAIYIEGGTLSAATATDEIAVLAAESISWEAGKISFDLAEDTGASDKIVLSGNLSKTGLPDALREIELVANPDDLAAWIEANDAPITYTLMEYSGTDMANSDVAFAQIGGINIEWNFGDTALTVTLGKVPEPAEVAAAIGAIALAAAFLRRRRQ